MTSNDGALDAETWLRRWDQQQAVYVPERENTFALMLDIIQDVGAVPGRVLDLGCGPGSLSARVLRRWPDADVTGIDLDPVLVELGRRTLGDAVRWLETDLRRPGWDQRLDGPPVDAVVSATALHWLDDDHVRRLARDLAGLMRPGAVFADYDTMLLDESVPRLRDLSHRLRLAAAATATAASTADDWDGWWRALRAEPGLADLFTERDARFGAHPHGPGNTLTCFTTAFRDAGFTEVAVLRQVTNRHLFVAIR